MPYITQERRDAILADALPETAGELNFAFTLIAAEYIQRKGLNYQNINDVVGALEGAKAEFYRRVAAPYEDTKIQQNGDVYPCAIISQVR
jgi:hypothetical protein